jgi:hypothetical protein
MKFNLGLGFLLWLAALAVLAHSPAFQAVPPPAARPLSPAVQADARERLHAELMQAAGHARQVAYAQLRSSQHARIEVLRQCR